jgi:hypothetical protein
MNSTKYESNAESKDREDFLKAIPLPDDVFLAAAKRAVINAGMSDEIVEILHPKAPEDRPRHSVHNMAPKS